MAIVAYVNGRIGGEDEAVISVLDHGFLYGEGVYEVVRTYNRRPFLFDRHLQRMRRSANMMALDLGLSDEEMNRRVRQTIAAFFARPENAGTSELYIRLLVTRGIGDFNYDASSCLSPSLVIIVKPLGSQPAEIYERGVKVALVSVVRNHPCSVSPLIKSNNLLNNALAFQEAQRKGAFEAILHNYRGEIAECSTANLFIVKDGTLLTPPLGAGLLSGITRGFVLDLCGAEGIPVEQRCFHDEDLFGSDETFLTSTTKEVVPIVQVDDRTIGGGRPGEITRRLLAAYRRKAQEMSG